MKLKTTLLSAGPSQADRELIAAAIRSQELEARSVKPDPLPFGYRARLARNRYNSRVRQLERRLRTTATMLDRWQVTVDPQLDITPLRTIFEQRRLAAPAAIRRQLERNEFLLLRLTGRLTAVGGVPLKTLRLGIELDPELVLEPQQAVFHSLFPRSEGRLFRGSQVNYALRPDFTFWVPTATGNAALPAAENARPSLRRMMLLGPMKMTFRKIIPAGIGAGTNRAEWTFTAGRETIRRTVFDLMMVLRVARGRNRVKAAVALDAEVLMPGTVAGVIGRTRLLYSAGRWSLPVPRPVVRTPSRLD